MPIPRQEQYERIALPTSSTSTNPITTPQFSYKYLQSALQNGGTYTPPPLYEIEGAIHRTRNRNAFDLMMGRVKDVLPLLRIAHKRARNATTPIGRASSDVLIEIFTYAYANNFAPDHPRRHQFHQQLSLAMGVCSRWFHLITGHAKFWTFVEISCWDPVERCEQLMKRSKGSFVHLNLQLRWLDDSYADSEDDVDDLSTSIDDGADNQLSKENPQRDESNTLESVIAALEPYVWKFQTLRIRVAGTVDHLIPFKIPLPALTSLDIDWNFEAKDVDLRSPGSQKLSSFALDTLKKFKLHLTCQNHVEHGHELIDLSPINFSQITSLSIIPWCGYPPLRILKDCINIESLLWSGDNTCVDEVLEEEVTLLRLHTLFVENYPSFATFTRFSSPNLRNLSVIYRDFDQESGGNLFLDMSRCPRLFSCEFQLDTFQNDPSEWLSFFEAHPELERISLCGVYITDSEMLAFLGLGEDTTRTLDEAVDHQSNLLCPRLRHLYLALSPYTDHRRPHSRQFAKDLLQVLGSRPTPTAKAQPGFRVTLHTGFSESQIGKNARIKERLGSELVDHPGVRLVPCEEDWDEPHPTWSDTPNYPVTW